MTEKFSPTARTTLKRLPKRGVFDRDAIYSILDEGFVCHIGFIVDGKPFVIPTGYARSGDRLFIHGSGASRMLRALSKRIEVCVTVTLLDGLVLARSAFHHSMNYRSVIVFGTANLVEDAREKTEALRLFSEHVIKGRWQEVRPPSPNELKATMVLTLPLEEASAKVRTGPPLDDEIDYEMEVWAGEIPLSLMSDAPVADQRLPAGINPPAYACDYTRSNKETK